MPRLLFVCRFLVCMAALFSLWGCMGIGGGAKDADLTQDKSAQETTTPEVVVSPQPAPLVHKVRWQGETLSLISLWYTGSFNNWTHIVKANSGLDPKRIRIGDLINIPASLVQTQKPLSQEFLVEHTRSQEPMLKTPPESPKRPMVDAQSSLPEDEPLSPALSPGDSPPEDALDPQSQKQADADNDAAMTKPPEAATPMEEPKAKAPPVLFGPKDF